ncbi:hypothetical protein A3860_13290 [Niastella vici]|uniref:Uncharacterized protein n=1 Tax=Niastella vici TaxID=1703345 RepID=A0A1V9G7A1_9BACT|nr:hypothetical protein [Niastella vici]OQP66460.1 hypothetical protein A3860_13290 [Niastella vici]
MKFYSFFLVVLLISCNTTIKKDHVKGFLDLLPHDTAINLNYEVYNTCTTNYFYAKDTTKGTLSRLVYYDKDGREKSTAYQFYESRIPATSLCMYDKDGRKTEEYYRIDEKGRLSSFTKTIFEYNESGKLARTIAFDFMRRMKEGIVRGLGTSGGCIVSDEDYEPKRSWALNTVWNYVYDKEGNLIEKFRSFPRDMYQDRYLYKYDNRGRLIEERSFSQGHLYYVESYQYYDGGYEYTRVLYDEDGTRAKQWNDSLETIDTFRYAVDRFNNQLEEKIIEEGGRLVSRDRNYYDKKNRIIRKEIYDEDGKLLGFYAHQYADSVVKPRQLNFSLSNESDK